MPFRSKAQMRYMYARHPKLAAKWARVTPCPKCLPEHQHE